MKIFLIILGVIIVIFLFAKIFSQKKMLIVDPISGLDFNGCMGINLGDPWQFVLSRMVHLKLISTQEAEEYSEKYQHTIKLGMTFSGTTFKSTTKFNNIEFLEFRVTNKEGILESITIKLTPEQTDMASLLDMCKNTLTRKFGKNPLVIKDRDNVMKRDMYLLTWNSPDGKSLINIDMIENNIHLAFSPSIFL